MAPQRTTIGIKADVAKLFLQVAIEDKPVLGARDPVEGVSDFRSFAHYAAGPGIPGWPGTGRSPVNFDICATAF